MQLQRIDTNRSYETWPSWQIFYELEDDIAAVTKAQLHDLKPFSEKIKKALFKFKLVPQHVPVLENPCTFCVMFNPDFHRLYLNKKNIVAYIVDYWKKYDIDTFNKNFRDCTIVYIASLEAMHYLQQNGCTLPLKHLGFSIADKYLPLFDHPTEKDIDIIQFGRKNLFLEDCIQEYCKKYPETNYVHRKLINNRNVYFSSRDGELGLLETREDFFRLLQRAKISIVSSPGLDGNTKTGGLNPVTVRVLESALARCHMLGRFVENEDYHYFRLQDIVHNITDYGHFEHSVHHLLSHHLPVNEAHYRLLIDAHLNSVRARQIMKDLETIDFI